MVGQHAESLVKKSKCTQRLTTHQINGLKTFIRTEVIHSVNGSFTTTMNNAHVTEVTLKSTINLHIGTLSDIAVHCLKAHSEYPLIQGIYFSLMFLCSIYPQLPEYD